MVEIMAHSNLDLRIPSERILTIQILVLSKPERAPSKLSENRKIIEIWTIRTLFKSQF